MFVWSSIYCKLFILINRAALYLKLGGDLTDEGDELLQVSGLAVLQHVLRRGWNEGQHLLLQTDDHAVEEGAHGAAQGPSLDGTAERRQEGLQTVQIHFRAAALLHRLLVTERLTGATEEEEQTTATGSLFGQDFISCTHVMICELESGQQARHHRFTIKIPFLFYFYIFCLC